MTAEVISTAEIIGFERKEVEPKCSFCKTLKSKTKHMCNSFDNKYHICDNCLKTCTNLITPKESA
jgi:hypothetical protein